MYPHCTLTYFTVTYYRTRAARKECGRCVGKAVSNEFHCRRL